MSADQSSVFLQSRATGKLVVAELFDGISDEHLQLWRAGWLPLIEQAKEEFRRQNLPRERWPQDLHWNWSDKAQATKSLLSYQGFALVCTGELQGLMLVNLSKHARLSEQFSKPLVYVEFLMTAPWNRRELTGDNRFRGVGLTLLRAAVELSFHEGYQGRLGLHSLPQADSFYRAACGMTQIGLDANYQNLTYYEMTTGQAQAFRTINPTP